jgi:SecD/SecF fusion protein
VIVASWALLVYRGIINPNRIFGIDFTGGSSVTFQFKQKAPVEDVRKTLSEAGLREVNIQYQEAIERKGAAYLVISTGDDVVQGRSAVDVVKSVLAEKHPDAGLTVAQEDEVGSAVGKELMRRSLWAVGIALVGMIVYLWWRFELGFAIGANVALIHDVLVTIGIYSLLGRQMSLPIVAVLLTIIGYSVNDTIVTFDRIREDLKLYPNRTFRDICNLSVNQVLSRTILTSLTVFIAVVSLLVLGGGAIFDFSLALFIGLIVGTYSTVYIATPVVLFWHHDRKPEIAFTPKSK